jgi:hypothetical protein
VEIRVGSVRHLPKMDLAGACDPYVLLSLGGERRKTRVFKTPTPTLVLSGHAAFFTPY